MIKLKLLTTIIIILVALIFTNNPVLAIVLMAMLIRLAGSHFKTLDYGNENNN